MSGPTPGQPPDFPDAYPAGLGPPPQGDPRPGAAPPQADPPTPAGYGAAPGYPQYPPPARGTDGFAIAALIFGIIGWILLSVVFGFVALSRIKRSGRGGRGLAIAALVLSGIWILIIAVIVVIVIANGATRTSSGEVVAAGSESVSNLKAGDCITDPPSGKDLTEINPNASVNAVPCNQPHTGEVFGVFDLPAGPYPGPAEVDRQVGAGCNDRLGTYSPAAVADPAIQIYTVFPLESSWKVGDREVMCIAGTDKPTTGSIRGR